MNNNQSPAVALMIEVIEELETTAERANLPGLSKSLRDALLIAEREKSRKISATQIGKPTSIQIQI